MISTSEKLSKLKLNCFGKGGSELVLGQSLKLGELGLVLGELGDTAGGLFLFASKPAISGKSFTSRPRLQIYFGWMENTIQSSEG